MIIKECSCIKENIETLESSVSLLCRCLLLSTIFPQIQLKVWAVSTGRLLKVDSSGGRLAGREQPNVLTSDNTFTLVKSGGDYTKKVFAVP